MENFKYKIYLVNLLAMLYAVDFIHAQDNIKAEFTIKADSVWLTDFEFISYSSSFVERDVLAKSASSHDSALFRNHQPLIGAEPNLGNHKEYYNLACSLWELNQLEKAENMFSTIIASEELFYTGIYFNSSDIPGDTSTNVYGYGSFTSNYKHYALRYLTKIYLQQGKYEQAFMSLKNADKKFSLTFNCGTGHHRYRETLDELYVLCYEGLEEYDSLIELYFPNCFDWCHVSLIRAIKHKYSRSEIDEQLLQAEKDMVFKLDTFQSSYYTIHNSGEKDEYRVETKYTSGTAIIILFGQELKIPEPHLDEGEIASPDMFLKRFKQSALYRKLQIEL